MIHVTLSEIIKAFRTHKEVIEKNLNQANRSVNMLLFYTVECGLKALYMKRNNLKNTGIDNPSNESASHFGHDLNRILAKLIINKKIPKTLAINPEQQIEPADLHAVWRYGRNLDREKEQACIKQLLNIYNEVKEKIAREC